MTAVFLDLDGTLMDSRPGILSSLKAAFREVGRTDLADGDLTWMIGPSFQETFKKIGLSDPAAATNAYRRHYDEGGAMFDAEVFHGIQDMLARLKEDGHRLYLATAKPIVAARKITAHFGLAPSMIAEFGPELDGTRAFKGELLEHALDMTGETASDAVMVGDRHHDFDAAVHVGMPSVAVKWGYGTADEWEAADHTIQAPSQLHSVLSAL
ncbi:MAG: HAD hydrolase-like protein [Pseudomonadota bacterium]